MTTEDSRKQSSGLALDTVAEDLFGLNIRGMKSILTLWRYPQRYFRAAETPDWQDEYTPSIRLWLSFFALLSALKFWWFGTNEGMIGAFASGFANAGIQLPEGVTYEDVGAEAVLWAFGLVPVLQIICMFLLSTVYNFWGRSTTLALRQRYLFAVMIPNASLMPVFLTIMLFIPQAMLSAYGMVLAVVTLLIDFQTGYRGGFSSVSKLGRLWRAALLALVLVTINAGTTIAAQIAGIIVIGQKYGLAPPG